MKTAAQRAQKRQLRENRDNKGAAAKIQSGNAQIRAARSKIGGWQTKDESMLLLAASMIGRR